MASMLAGVCLVASPGETFYENCLLSFRRVMTSLRSSFAFLYALLMVTIRFHKSKWVSPTTTAPVSGV